MCPTLRKNGTEKPQELIDIWSRKSTVHSRKKELLQVQCELEAKMDEIAKKKLDLSNRIDSSVERHSSIKAELKRIERDSESLGREVAGIEERIDSIAGDISALDRREKEKLKELEEVRQRKTQADGQKAELAKKKADAAASLDVTEKRKGELSKEMDKLAGEHSKLREELEEIEKEEESSIDAMGKIENELNMIKDQISELDKREHLLMESLERDKKFPSDFLGMLTSPFRAASQDEADTEEQDVRKIMPEIDDETENEPDTGRDKEETGKKVTEVELVELEKKSTERIQELKKAFRVIDRLIGDLPMETKKKFCSSRCFGEYEKLHKIVFNYEGSASQNKYVREHVKWVLSEIDRLLGKLPEGTIDKFIKSKDYEQYSSILEVYGIQP